MGSGNQTRYVVRHDETIAFFTSYPSKRDDAAFEMDNELFKKLFDFELENETLYKLPSSSVDQEVMKVATLPFLKTDLWDGK